MDDLHKTFSTRIKSMFLAEHLNKKMWLIFASLLPASIVSFTYFGQKALLIIFLSVLVGILTQGVGNTLRKQPLYTGQGAAVVASLLFSLLLPSTVPFQIVVFGTILIVLFIHIFGGAQNALFHPTLIGLCILILSFPTIMTNFLWPDGITTLNPLHLLSQGELFSHFGTKELTYSFLFFSNVSGSIGEVSLLALLFGGMLLLLTKIIDWRIPLSYMLTLVAVAFLFRQSPLVHLFSGGLFLSAFFLSTTFSSPTKQSRKIWYGIGCGLLTFILRQFSVYYGAIFAVLFMNALIPLLDHDL